MASLEQIPSVHCDTDGQVFKSLILMKDGPDVEVIRVLEIIFWAMDGVVLRWLHFGDSYDPNEAKDALCLLTKPRYGGFKKPTATRIEMNSVGMKCYAAASPWLCLESFSKGL